MIRLLPREFYTRSDVIRVARELLCKCLVTQIDGQLTSGMIVETEAYEGVTDRASHAFNNRRTERTAIMYRNGGTAYVYLCYGIHSLFNVVTNREGIPHAVLIRGIVPLEGVETMLKRVRRSNASSNMGIGPGKVSKMLGIHYSHTGLDLTREPGGRNETCIWIEDRGILADPKTIVSGPRIGVDYAGGDALLPYRFRLEKKKAEPVDSALTL